MIIEGENAKLTDGNRPKKIYYYPAWSFIDERVTTVGEIIDERKALCAAYKDFLRDGDADKAIEKGLS